MVLAPSWTSQDQTHQTAPKTFSQEPANWGNAVAALIFEIRRDTNSLCRNVIRTEKGQQIHELSLRLFVGGLGSMLVATASSVDDGMDECRS
jgi:hypothetical protein